MLLSVTSGLLNALRRRAITAMPQDPLILILPGSIRSNMDPFSQYAEEAIISAFEEVHLWPTVSARGGLDASADSLALSRGQQQLFCLARVLLSEAPIVVFDEVTANVDPDTAARVMEIINTRFVSRTVLVIAHQLWTIRRFDQIAVLEQGRLVELGDPEQLLQQETAFRRLWRRHHAEGDA
ncbi:P-loop containing nucleoside triphosphate hydrolase protein [Aspergillus campestris IBT 28561]|uniref:P-loop containing nucleoside triphosphate hydrolase protein n=1 Tax=Aspergillus campestris (strain IBT 28561) TaxID=1392248 RepID=A0A2I1DHH8_ASPC2|nr:P-loop containing nucleoside triphosphate hydrolase protein [Aspergillus campestris IBT 28561]PKY09326.1 P-loop containing nucleoside triphosphate hydrolase protein [Aspergillus campestris IBT 28561]